MGFDALWIGSKYARLILFLSLKLNPIRTSGLSILAAFYLLLLIKVWSSLTTWWQIISVIGVILTWAFAWTFSSALDGWGRARLQEGDIVEQKYVAIRNLWSQLPIFTKLGRVWPKEFNDLSEAIGVLKNGLRSM